MTRHQDEDGSFNAESELRITHFIPSVELKGSRAEKLDKLDVLIRYLERLRGQLARPSREPRSTFEGPSRLAGVPNWPWSAVGVALVLLLVAVTALARSCV